MCVSGIEGAGLALSLTSLLIVESFREGGRLELGLVLGFDCINRPWTFYLDTRERAGGLT
jgi:hypothetical protein